MAKLDISGERLFLLRGVILQSINEKTRSAKDTRHFAEQELEREKSDPDRHAELNSESLFKIADSMDLAVQNLKETFHDVCQAMEEDDKEEARLRSELVGADA
jgi:hypothetical protein